MVLAENTSHYDDDAELITVVLKLDRDAYGLLAELMRHTGREASELVGWALGAQWRELEGVALPPPSGEDPAAALAESEADILAGRTAPHDEVFARIDAKHGW